jgi:tetratricopeptide (TPR) repeat protein
VDLLVAVGLLLVTLALFGRGCWNGFVNYDDPQYVTLNPHVEPGLTAEDVGWAWRTTYFGNWHPLLWMSLQLDSQVYTLKRPAGFHATSLLLHAASVVTLFWVLRRMTGALWRSALVAALFAVHPLNVEPVAWVAERKGVLSTFFWMLTLLAYLQYAERPGLARYLLVVLAFGLGFLAKPMLVTLPFVLLLLDYWPLGRWAPAALPARSASEGEEYPSLALRAGSAGARAPLARLLWEKAPLFVLSVAFIAVAAHAQHGTGALTSLKASFPSRVGNACLAYVTYVRKAVWPSDLAPFYPHRGDSVSLWQAGAAAGLLAAVTVAAFRAAPRRPYVMVGWLWYVGTLVPVIGLVPIGWQGSADRYTYVPLVGLFILTAWGGAELACRWRCQTAAATLAGALLLGLAVVTWNQEGYWHDSETLWRHALRVTADNPVAETCLGTALKAEGQLPEALRHFEAAVRLDPEFAFAHYSLGMALLEGGKFGEAARHFAVTVRRDPDFAPGHYYLGVALENQGQIEKAMRQYEEAVGLDPDNVPAHNSLGVLLESKGQVGEAVRHYQEALRRTPGDAGVHFNLGGALAKEGKLDEAIEHFTEAVRIDGGFARAHRNLGAALEEQGRLDEASRHYGEALRLDPGDAVAHSLAAGLLAAQGKVDEAARHCETALGINARDADGWHRLGSLRLRQGKTKEAVACFQKAVDLQTGVARFRCGLASALHAQGQAEAAAEQYREASRLDPNWQQAALHEAWSRAVNADPKLRDGPRAVELAEQVCRAPGGKGPQAPDTLAAAYAATGRFDDAVAAARQARTLASAAGQEVLVREIEGRLRLYERGEPFRETPTRSLR